MARTHAAAACVLAAYLCGAVLAASAAPPVPSFTTCGTDWQYVDANGTALAHYQFRWFFDQNVVRFQQYFADYTTTWYRDYNNFTSTVVVLQYSDNSCCINAQTGQPPVRTIAEDVGVNLPSIPADARYVGRALVDGLWCDGWEFVWDQDSLPVISYVYTDPKTGDQSPVRLMLPHNGRSLKYNAFTSTPDLLFYEQALAEYRAKCTVGNPCPGA